MRLKIGRLIGKFVDPRSAVGKAAKTRLFDAIVSYSTERRLQLATHKKGATCRVLEKLYEGLAQANAALVELSSHPSRAYQDLSNQYCCDHFSEIGDDDGPSGCFEPTRSFKADVADLTEAAAAVLAQWQKQPPTPANHLKILLIAEVIDIAESLTLDLSSSSDDPHSRLKDSTNPLAWLVRRVLEITGEQPPKDLSKLLGSAMAHWRDPRGDSPI